MSDITPSLIMREDMLANNFLGNRKRESRRALIRIIFSLHLYRVGEEGGGRNVMVINHLGSV